MRRALSSLLGALFAVSVRIVSHTLVVRSAFGSFRSMRPRTRAVKE